MINKGLNEKEDEKKSEKRQKKKQEKNRKAGKRVMESTTTFIEQKLKLKVNRKKSAVDLQSPREKIVLNELPLKATLFCLIAQ